MKTSIVILTYNNFLYSKHCIESIRNHTKECNYEIIVVDNGSTDETVAWLKNQEDLRLILNPRNMGFPKGCNQGIKAATGNSVLLLNNDTIVTPKWLVNLTRCLYSNDSIGAVGAVTNNCSYYQDIPINYQTLEEMQEFAEIHNHSNPDLWEERLKLVGFCMLIKKEAIEKVGLLDESFSPGNYEDDDYSMRLRLAGYRLVLCKDAFIHHFASATFRANVKTFSNLLQINKQKFRAKWGFDPHYSSSIRTDVIGLMDSPPDEAIRVLEVGCACGGTLLKIRDKYKRAELFGIELDTHAAEMAKAFANIVTANIETAVLNYPIDFLDYIILADVLEHLANPWSTLAKLKKHLKHSGKILASIPNVMHYSVIRRLFRGSWTYEDAGILDRTHLRFFTLQEIHTMFLEAGYTNLQYVSIVTRPNEEDERFIRTLAEVAEDKNLAAQFRAYQYLVTGSPEIGPEKMSEPVNTKLKFLLRRLENDISVEESKQTLVEMFLDSSLNLTVDSLIKAFKDDIVNKQKVSIELGKALCSNGLADYLEALTTVANNPEAF